MCQNKMRASTLFFLAEKHDCSLAYRKCLSDYFQRALQRPTWASARVLLVENTISRKQGEKRNFLFGRFYA